MTAFPADGRIPDGNDVAEGSTSDAAVTSDAAGTVSGKLRGLVKILADVWDSAGHRLKVDGSAVTQPSSVADGGSVSLGAKADAAATSDTGTFSLIALVKRLLGKFPALGSATSANSWPVVVASDQAAVPVSGTVTANAGTGTLATSVADGANATIGTTTDAATANTVIGRLKKLISLLPTALGQTTMANSLPVTLASDQSKLGVTTADGDQATIGAKADAAVTTDTSGSVVAFLRGLVKILGDVWDSTNHRLKVDGSGVTQPVSGTVTANAGTGTLTTQGQVGAGNTVSGNPFTIGVRATTANPSAATDGNVVRPISDKVGRLPVVVGHIRDLVTHAQTAIGSTSETTILGAGGAGVFHDITQLTIENREASATRYLIKDSTGGTTQLAVIVPANETKVFPFVTPLKQGTANNNWTVTASQFTTGSDVTVQAVKNI